MNTIIYIILGVFVLMYIIDKKEIVKPIIERFDEDENIPKKKFLTFEEKKMKQRNELYKSIFQNIQDINPLKTYRVWTYVEIINDSRNIQLSYTKYKIPVYFKKCIDLMKENVPELIVLTPLNIKEYLPDFDLEMDKKSIIPLKIRVDILYASILKKYGGICVSPGTVIYDLSNPLSLLHKYELVTFGGNPSVLQSQNHLYLPNSYVIGSQKNGKTISEYLRLLKMSIKNDYHYNINTAKSEDILSHVIKSQKPTQFHYGTEYDGSYNSKYQVISIDNYIGTSDIDFLNKDKLLFINFPYDILLEMVDYEWFINISEIQFLESNIILKRLLFKDI